MSQPDHIVVVVEENHDTDQVIGNPNAKYINGTLLANGLYYTNAHGTDHPSQPNYLEMFSGTNPGAQGVNSPLQQRYPSGAENTPTGLSGLAHGDDYNTGQPFSDPNLGAELLAAGKSFAGYSEDLPYVGFTGAQSNGMNGNRSYVDKHNAWAQFQGSGTHQLPADTNQPFTAFHSISDFSKLPTVSFVVPNEYNDMHDTVSKNGFYQVGKTGVDKNGDPVNDDSTIQNGDTWLSNNIEAYREWATTHNSLLVTVWDENDYDFTNNNDIPLIIDGDPRLVQKGVNSSYVNHFDLLKTLESDNGLAPTGLAATANGLSVNGDGKLLAERIDKATFNFKFTDAHITEQNGFVFVDGPDGSHTVLYSTKQFAFTDGTVNEYFGLPLVDDLYYYTHNKDVWNAHQDATTHYNSSGWHEGRDPNAFFSTTGYLGDNPDVKAAGINPLQQYDQFGWKEGRDPGANFDTTLYLQNNPDVKAAGIDPLAHFLQYGQAEGRQAYAAIGPGAAINQQRGFDAEFYLLSNPDVAKAAPASGDVNAFALQHYNQYGWHEGRNPNAFFDTKGYLAAYSDVAKANINPLQHYDQYGYKEGRDPSASFDTKQYEAHYADVNAAHIDPLVHYLQYGVYEGRSAFADGHFG